MTLITLIKKEIFELIKTKKFLVLPIVVLFFALSSPIFAKLAPEIIKNMTTGELEISLPEPTMKDSYLQLTSNLNQIVLFILIFTSTSVFINDKIKGRLVLLLSKPINRSNILISKFINLALQLFMSLFIGSLFFALYTQVIFKEFDIILYIQVIGLFFLYGLFLISLTMFASTISKSYLVSITVSIVTFFALGALNFFTFDFLRVSPGKATTLQQIALEGGLKFDTITTDTFWFLVINILSTIVYTVVLILASIEVFKRQEIE